MSSIEWFWTLNYFLQNELCPLALNRHVIKYLLGRKSGFHDLAFFDPDMYESLRQLIVDAKNQVTIWDA